MNIFGHLYLPKAKVIIKVDEDGKQVHILVVHGLSKSRLTVEVTEADLTLKGLKLK